MKVEVSLEGATRVVVQARCRYASLGKCCKLVCKVDVVQGAVRWVSKKEIEERRAGK